MSLARDLTTDVRARGITLRPASCTGWLTARGHLNPIVRQTAPVAVLDTLDELHRALGGDRRVLARQRDAALPTGLLVAPSGQLVEIDDIGHFTSARLTSLAYYPATTTFGFNLDLYRSLIEAWRERAAAVFTRRWNPDFDFAGGRRARRAYEDALADLLAPIFTGFPLLRVASPDGDTAAAADRLIARLA